MARYIKFVEVEYLDYNKKTYMFYNKHNIKISEGDLVVVMSSHKKLGLAKVIKTYSTITPENADKIAFVNKAAYIVDRVDTKAIKKEEEQKDMFTVIATKLSVQEPLNDAEKEMLTNVSLQELQNIAEPGDAAIIVKHCMLLNLNEEQL